MEDIRCGQCGRKLATASTIVGRIKCPRCGTINHYERPNAVSPEPRERPTPERP